MMIKDTLPDWLPPIEGTTTKRVENNNYLYNGGTLSNCLNVDTNIKASKTWKASSFQAEFEDVIVEMTLQSRPKTADNTGIWSNAEDKDCKEIRRVKYGFGEEELETWNVEATVSKYGLHLVARWNINGWRPLYIRLRKRTAATTKNTERMV